MHYHKGTFKQLGMIAGGTGMMMMYQLIQAIYEDLSDDTKISLMFTNATEDNIILRLILDKFEDSCPERLKIWYVLDRPPKG